MSLSARPPPITTYDKITNIYLLVTFCTDGDCVDGGQIVIEFVETGRQLADVLTKPLGRLRLMELKEMIGMEGVQGIAVGLGKELLDNLLLPCVNTQQGKTALKRLPAVIL